MKQDKPAHLDVNPTRLKASTGEGVQIYLGPSAPLLIVESQLLGLYGVSLAYSFDTSLQQYRWTMTRPLCEGRMRFIERVERFLRNQEGPFGIGIVTNGVKEAPAGLPRRGLWLSNCTDIHEALSVNPQTPMIVDVVAGVCARPQAWDTPPAAPINDTEF